MKKAISRIDCSMQESLHPYNSLLLHSDESKGEQSMIIFWYERLLVGSANTIKIKQGVISNSDIGNDNSSNKFFLSHISQ